MQASDIMTESPVCVMPSDSIQMAARQMQENSVGMLPVVMDRDDMRLAGVLTDRDIVCRVVAQGRDCASATVGDAMTSGELWTVTPDVSVDEVIERMEEGQVRRIPVVDEDSRVLGVIATADIALELEEPEAIAEVFEEISEPTNIPHA